MLTLLTGPDLIITCRVTLTELCASVFRIPGPVLIATRLMIMP